MPVSSSLSGMKPENLILTISSHLLRIQCFQESWSDRRYHCTAGHRSDWCGVHYQHDSRNGIFHSYNDQMKHMLMGFYS